MPPVPGHGHTGISAGLAPRSTPAEQGHGAHAWRPGWVLSTALGEKLPGDTWPSGPSPKDGARSPDTEPLWALPLSSAGAAPRGFLPTPVQRAPSVHPPGWRICCGPRPGPAASSHGRSTTAPPGGGGVLLGPSPRWEALSGLAKATRWARPARSKPVAQTPSPRPTGPGRREGHTHSAWRPPALPTPLSNPCPSGKPEARTWLRSGASRGSRPETLSGNRSREVKRSRPLFGRPVGATGCVMADCSARQSYPPRGPLT